MAKINPCFKKIFVFFNVLFAILGVLILGLGLLALFQLREYEGNEYTGAFALAVIGAVIFILSVLGAYGAQKENKNVLIAFFVIMCVGTIALLRLTVSMAITREEVMSMVKEELRTVPLNHPDVKNAFEYFQEHAKCCGLFKGYQDWGSEVPASCNCADSEVDQCQRMSIYEELFSGKSRRVYTKPCGPIILEYLDKFMTITLGVLFGFGALALLAAVMSLGMIIRITSSTPSLPPIFALDCKPPKYSELVPSA